MHRGKLIGLFIILSCKAFAQEQANSYDGINAKSYALYEKGDWKTLLSYGKESIATADFISLRLRMGYAALMLGNFSEALKQYDAVLKKDSYNEAANYYSWQCRLYLNQAEIAGAHVNSFSKEWLKKQKQPAYAAIQAGAELSFKNTGIKTRGNGLYARLDLHTRITSNINMHQACALYDQTISENKLQAVINNGDINISQKEYYNKIVVNVNRQWQLIGAYHYLYTPFNNFVYNNHIGMAGIKYMSYYFTLQTDAVFGKMTDSSLQQYEATLSIYPTGNLNIYSISTTSLRNRNNNSAFNLKEVLGAKVLNLLWLEGNATIGSFSNFFENDALYVYNAVDKNLFKGGITAYIVISPALVAQAGYTFEQKEFFKSTNTFIQHSITGGILCKF